MRLSRFVALMPQMGWVVIMHRVARLPANERADLFRETAALMRTTPAIVEKDFWVVWVLAQLFAQPELARVLKFKGGTSLSKVFGVIGRFSEDIDLILDWREVVRDDPRAERSKTQQNIVNEAANAQAEQYIAQQLLPLLHGCLGDVCRCEIDQLSPQIVHIIYPAAFNDPYLRPAIFLEIGPLASWLPSDVFEIRSYAAEYFAAVFEQPSCHVPTILAKRTFWEKATILHQEVHRPIEKPLPSRYSRHYYDLARLALSDVRVEALADLDLLAEVVAFKQKFYPSAWAQYELAVPATLRLLPSEVRVQALARDYEAMQAMIFDQRLSFDEVMDVLAGLQSEVNLLGSRL